MYAPVVEDVSPPESPEQRPAPAAPAPSVTKETTPAVATPTTTSATAAAAASPVSKPFSFAASAGQGDGGGGVALASFSFNAATAGEGAPVDQVHDAGRFHSEGAGPVDQVHDEMAPPVVYDERGLIGHVMTRDTSWGHTTGQVTLTPGPRLEQASLTAVLERKRFCFAVDPAEDDTEGQ